jgi:hypothetical protein
MKGDENSLKRLAYIAVYAISINTSMEKLSTKPFNPLLGETFEYCNDKYEFISEQVTHHPPNTAWHCRGKSGFSIWKDTRVKI